MTNSITDTTEEPKLAVHMHSELAERFGHCFSPMDAIAAFNHLSEQLPQLHRKRSACEQARRRIPLIRIYHAYFDWFPVGVTYVQVGNSLIVIDVWFDDENRFTRRFDFRLVDTGW